MAEKVEEKTETTPTSAVEKAVTELSKPGEKVEEKKEVKKDESTEVKDDDETKKAKDLYNLINDPEKGRDFIKFLAEQVGLLTGAGEKKEDAVEDALSILKKELGPDYAFLAEKFAPALEKLVDKKLGEVKDTLHKREEREAKLDFNLAWDKVDETSKGALNKHSKEVAELTKEYPYVPSEKNTIERYLRSMLKLASASGESEDSVIEKTVDRINKNAKEARVASSDVDESRVTKGKQYPTVEEAVQAAYQEMVSGRK